jgi:hypothetical protein
MIPPDSDSESWGKGAMIDCPIVLIEPLPKGSLPAQTVHSGARMAELRRNMNEVCRRRAEVKLQTRTNLKDVQLERFVWWGPGPRHGVNGIMIMALAADGLNTVTRRANGRAQFPQGRVRLASRAGVQSPRRASSCQCHGGPASNNRGVESESP